MKISVLVPAYNEEANIVELVHKIESTLDFEYELLIVNDHSNDRTVELINNLKKQFNNIRLVDNKRDKGFANALKTGFENIRTEAVVPVMSDLSDDLNSIKKMLILMENGYDVVCGSRYMNGGERLGGSKIKAFLSRMAGLSLKFLLGLPTHDISNSFKLYKKKVLDNLQINAQSFDISMEIPLKAYWMGFKIGEVPTAWKERTKGKSSFKVLKLLPRFIKLYFLAIFKRLFKGK